MVLAPSGRPTPFCRDPAHLETDSFLAAVTDFRDKPAEKGHHEDQSVSASGFGERRDLTSFEVL